MDLDDGFFRRLLDHLHDGVYFVDPTRKILYWNDGAERIAGYSRQEMVGKFCPDNILQHTDETGRLLCLVGCPLTRALHEGETHEEEVFLRHKDGHRVPVLVKATPVRDPEGRVIGAVELFSDNSRKMAAVSKAEVLERQALLDPLTGLGNRRYCDDVLKGMLKAASRTGKPFGVLMMDLDRFKDVNDRHGHDVGDEVLRMVAKTISDNMRGFDFVGRWGGEEFLALVAETDEEGLFYAADRCRVLVGKSYIEHGGGNVSVTLSVGATLHRPKDDATSLIKRADRLLYVSKEKGRNRVTMDSNPI